ncbi:MAG TPA: hypothetical protein VF487_12455 [Chitinophagaceae bacterium]
MILLNFTAQLFYYPIKSTNQNVIPVQVASSVLFKTDNDYFLVTAKHVFSDVKLSDIIILLNDGNAVQLYGEIGFFIVNKPHDNLDIAILKLDMEIVKQLEHQYSFLHYKNIDFSHDYNETNNYMLLGFINKQTELKGKTFQSTPFGFLTQLKRMNKLSDLRLNDIENIALRYNRRKQTFLFNDVKQLGPQDLTGLSGGGIWFVRQYACKPHLQYCSLVGIMIEQLRGTNRGIVVGTKIYLAFEILEKHFGVALTNQGISVIGDGRRFKH